VSIWSVSKIMFFGGGDEALAVETANLTSFD
jgi:hypothetical protein